MEIWIRLYIKKWSFIDAELGWELDDDYLDENVMLRDEVQYSELLKAYRRLE